MAGAALPEDIITIILVRLPVKSLGRFRCVCKPWHSFINNPYFIRKHIDRVNMGNEYDDSAMLVVYPSLSTNVISMDINEGGRGANHQDGIINNNRTIVFSFENIDFPKEFGSPCFTIKGSCDGLLCMTSDDYLVLWNPSLKKHTKLPLSCEQLVGNIFYVYGIGYDPSLDDYKVLRVPSSGFGHVSRISNSLVEILTLKSMSWKTIQNHFRYDIVFYSHSTLVNGALHWVATNTDTPREEVILYFDVMKEKFGELPLPPGKNTRRNMSYLQQFEGNLCFMVNFSQGKGHLDIWVMKEYGVQESWSKLLSFLPGPGVAVEPIHLYCSIPDGLLLFNKLRGRFVLYNPREKTFTTLCDNNDCIDKPFTRNIVYVKSLVSPIK